MIKEGNYSWLDYESFKPQLIDVFTEYYGNEHVNTIDSRVNSIKYVPYHTFEYVNEYYKRFIMRYRDDILNNFFAVTKMKRNPDRESVLLPADAESLDDSDLLTLVDPSIFYMQEGGITKETLQKLEKMKKKACGQFGIHLTDPKVDEKLVKIRNLLIGAIKQTERDHPCDVFNDMQTLDNNYNRAYRELLLYAQKLGFDFSTEDRKIINTSSNLMLDKNRLDSDGIFFHYDISMPGVMDAYTSIANEILNKKGKGQEDTKYLIYFKRLEYMRICGVSFATMNMDDFTVINPAILSDETKKMLETEYLYQMEHGEDIPEIPSDIADKLEIKRKGLVDMLFDNCKFDENLRPTRPYGYDHSSESSTQFFMVPENKRGKVSRMGRFIYFCEDENITPESRLSNMLHESNHALSNHLLVKNYRQGEERTGLEVQDVDIFGNDIVASTGYDPFIRAIMENSNEKQTKELLDLFIKKFGNVMPTSDIQIPQHEFVALYRYSDFLTQEFYSIFGTAIKRFNVDPDYDIYFKKSVSDTLLGRLKGHITRKIDRRFRPDEYAGETGVLDYEKVRRLGALISDWEQNYVMQGLVEGVTPENLIRGVKLEELEPAVIKKIFSLRRQKDVIMEGMIDDLTKYTQLRNMQELVLTPEQLAALGVSTGPDDSSPISLDITDAMKGGYVDEDQMED